MNFKKKAIVLITGSTGYIGGNITRKMAAMHPEVTIFALTRQSADKASEKYKETARFTNVKFVQGDCLKAESLDESMLRECDAVVHSVGAITDLLDYKQFLNPTELQQKAKMFGNGVLNRDAATVISMITNEAQEVFNVVSGQGLPYEKSLEAQNRDSTKIIAEKFNTICGQQMQEGGSGRGVRGTFVFLSAEPSILPIPNLVKYAEMKRQAEVYLEQSCPNLNTTVVRPGLVTDPTERPMTVPLGYLSDFGRKLHTSGTCPLSKIAGDMQPAPLSTALAKLSDTVIEEALAEQTHAQDDTRQYKIISAEQMRSTSNF